MTVKDKEKGTSEDIRYTVSKDECNRPSTTLESLQGLQPVRGEDDPHATVTAGNASQLSDGAAACVVMDGALASSRGVEPLGICGYVRLAARRTRWASAPSTPCRNY